MRDRRLIQRDERGATLIVVAVFAIVAMIMAAAVIDIGALRAEKKEVTLSTDAAALAAVSVIDYADPDATGSGTSCAVVDSLDPDVGGVGNSPTVEDVAEYYLTENGESIFGTCEIFFGAAGQNEAYLTVTATEDVDYRFGQAIGANGGTVVATSSARAGSASVDGVYPIGVCGNDVPGAGDFVNPAQPFPQYFDGNEEISIDFGNSNCGASGNHDQIDFVGGYPSGACGQNSEDDGAFCYDLNNGGYDGFIPPNIGSNPGGGGWNPPALSDPIEDLEDRAVHIWVPIVGPCSSNCSGNNSIYPVEYLAEVVINFFKASGGGAGIGFDVYQVVDYAYYQANGLPLTTVAEDVEAHICATTVDTSGCTNNPTPGPPPPPPPPPVPCAGTTTTSPSGTVPVDSSGALTAPLVVTVTVQNMANCNIATSFMDAIAGATRVSAPAPPVQNGSTLEFTYAAGTVFSATNGTVFTMEFSEDGQVRDSGTTVTIQAPTCSVSLVSPRPSVSIPYTQSGNGSNAVRRTDSAQAWQVTIDTPNVCGSVSGKLTTTQGQTPIELNLAAPATLTTTSTWTLPANTTIPNNGANNTWNVRLYNNGTVINGTNPNNTATVTFSKSN